MREAGDLYLGFTTDAINICVTTRGPISPVSIRFQAKIPNRSTSSTCTRDSPEASDRHADSLGILTVTRGEHGSMIGAHVCSA